MGIEIESIDRKIERERRESKAKQKQTRRKRRG
jgi:hypothetical protein